MSNFRQEGKLFLALFRLSLLSILLPFFLLSSATNSQAITLVTISGQITKGGVAESGATVALNQCLISGVEGGATDITDSSGFYSLEVPAGCTGSLSIGTRQEYTATARPILQVQNGSYTAPLTNATVNLDIPSRLTVAFVMAAIPLP